MPVSVKSPGANFGGIDIMRFLSAVMVMLYHYGFWIWAYPSGMAAQAASASTGALGAAPDFGGLVRWGWVGVQVFFVISGFVIAFSAERGSVTSFVRARVLRLVPAVWICAPISIVAFWVTGSTWGSDAVSRLVHSVFFVPFGPWVDSVYWTLGIEIVFYGLIAVMLLTGQQRRIWHMAVVLGLISTVFWLAVHLAGSPRWLTDNRWLGLLLIHHGCFFALGVHLLHLYRHGVSSGRLAWGAVFLCGCVMQIDSTTLLGAAKTGLAASPAAPIVAFFLAVGCLAGSLRMTLSHPIWRQLGMMTYPLYLLHNVVGAAMIGSLVRAGVGATPAIVGVALVMIGICWLIATQAEPVLRRLLATALTVLADPVRRLTARPG